MVITTLLLASLVALVIWNIWERKRKLGWFQSIGISCDTPSLLLGNVSSLRQKGIHAKLQEWTVKYGKVFGYYEGTRPVLVVSEVDIIKQILIKDFNFFSSRKKFPLMDPNDKHGNMFDSHGVRWRRQRALSSPTFSALRMKEMSPLINSTAGHLMDVLDGKVSTDQPFNIHELFQRMTLDTIACCAFGMEVNSLKNPDDIFLQKCRYLFFSMENRSTLFSLTIPFAIMFPDIFSYVRPLVRAALPMVRTWFYEAAAQIIKQRKVEKADRVDFIQLMLNAEESNVTQTDLGMTVDDPEDKVNDHQDNDPRKAQTSDGKETSEKEKKGLSLQEIQGQCMLFLLAGYETTSTALGFTAYELALHPDIQEKVHQEIDKHFPEQDPRPDYGSVARLAYLDIVISEVLRMHPIGALAVTRQCFEPCTIAGIPFRIGDCVQMNMAAVHQDPELWGPEDPQLFVPERFLPERKQGRHPMAWMPFGGGPRNCVGMRFALMEIKVTLIRLLKTYAIRACGQTEVPLPTGRHAIPSPSKGVWVKLERRNPATAAQ